MIFQICKTLFKLSVVSSSDSRTCYWNWTLWKQANLQLSPVHLCNAKGWFQSEFLSVIYVFARKKKKKKTIQKYKEYE